MPETREQLLKRIRHLVAVARDQEGLPEGDVAAGIADRLMREHAVSEADLDADPDRVAVLHVPNPASWTLWEQALMTVVGEFVGVQVAVVDKFTMWLCGTHTSLDVHAFLFDVAHRHIAGQAAHSREDTDWFCRSAVVGFQQKLRALRATASAEDPRGTSLLHVRDGRVVGWLAERGVVLDGGHEMSFRALNAGLDAGRTVPVHDAIEADAAVPRLPKSG